MTTVRQAAPARLRSVAIPMTVDGDGIGKAVAAELVNLGFQPLLFPMEQPAPDGCDAIFIFGPFGKFLHLSQQYEGMPKRDWPVLIYWNTEGLPDPRLPLPLARPAGALRSWLGRLELSRLAWQRKLAGNRLFASLEPRGLRFRYLGDYLYAWRKGWIDVIADISAVYAKILRRYGIPAIAAPFGAFPGWYDSLGIERDIDVLWMGKRGSRRRSEALDRLRAELQKHGVDIYMVDNVEHPFAFDQDRTVLLNRARITLNLLRTWYDENSLRIALAAPNRSLVASEPLLPHVPQYQPGVHYVSAPLPELAETILYYLKHEQQSRQLVENAYALTTQTLTFRNTVRTIMEAAEQSLASRGAD